MANAVVAIKLLQENSPFPNSEVFFSQTVSLQGGTHPASTPDKPQKMLVVELSSAIVCFPTTSPKKCILQAIRNGNFNLLCQRSGESLPFMVSPHDFAASCRMLNPKTRKNPCQQWKNLSHRFAWFACRWICQTFEKPEVFPCHTSCVYGVVASSNNHGHQMTALWLCLEIKWVKHWNDSWVCRCQKQIPWT